MDPEVQCRFQRDRAVESGCREHPSGIAEGVKAGNLLTPGVPVHFSPPSLPFALPAYLLMMTGTMELEEAIARVRKGDRNAYAHVVHALAAPLRAYVASYCPGPERVDEVSQRAFTWAFKNLARYEQGTAFFSWLKQIAKNVLLEELEVRMRDARNRKRYLEFLEAKRSKSVLSSRIGDSSLEEFDALQSCLEQLSGPARELIQMRYEDQRPIDQIARKRDMSGPAVKMALLRARDELRKCVEQKTGRVTTGRR